MALFRRYSPALIGIDIEPHALRLVQLRKTKSQWLVERMATTSLNKDIFADCKIKNWETLGAELMAFVNELDLVGGMAVFHLPARLVRMKHLTLAKELRHSDIEAEIYAEVLKDLPDSQEALSIDYKRIKKDDVLANIFFVAAKQAYISQYMKCVHDAGLRPKIVDIDIFALRRAITFSLSPNHHHLKRELIFHALRHHATLMAFDEETPVFFKHWELDDSHDFLHEFNNHLQLCLSTLGEVDQLVLSADHSLCTLIENNLTQNLVIKYPDFLAHDKLLFSDLIQESFVFSHARECMLAFGLAMRECPKW